MTYNDTSKLIQESDIIINPISSAIIEAFYYKNCNPSQTLFEGWLFIMAKFKCCYEVKIPKKF